MKKKLTANSAFFNPRVVIVVVLCLLGVVLTLFGPGVFSNASILAQGARPNLNAPGSHKLSVRDRGLAASLQAQGAHVIADYGSYVLLQTTDAVARSIENNPRVENMDHESRILLNSRTINTLETSRSVASSKGGKQMRLIQFAGPVRPEWYQALVGTGVRVVTYIPFNSYLVYGAADRIQAAQGLAANKSIVQWEGAYTAAERLDPRVTRSKDAAATSKAGAEAPAQPNLSARGNEQFVIQLVDDPDENKATLALIDKLKLEPVIAQDKVLGYVNVKVALPREAVIRQIAERADVVSIQEWVTPELMCERQDMIMAGNLTGNSPNPGDYLAYLAGKGFNLATPANFGVNLSDSGLDNGTATPDQFLFYTLGDPTVPANSRVVYVVNGGTPTELRGCNGHGHLNSSIVGGYVPTGISGGVNFGAFPHADASGFRWGLGIAPFVKLGMSVIFGATGAFTNPVYETLESNAYAAGMRISSNSWGAAVGGAYNTDSQRYDAIVRDAQTGTAGNQEYTIVFSAGNSGSGANTIGSPGTGKNVITVGAAEDVNPFGGSDGCSVADSGADSANDIIGFSSRGPCDDGRIKPDIMGPGTHVSGAAPQSGPNVARTGNGSHLACFTASGVCGGVTPNDFFPAGQEWYTASSGTSHSCPAVAGTVALYRQHFINQALTPPSPAMNKALLMTSARYMNGVGANDTLFSNNQGMGEANLNSFFDIFATPSVLRDEVPGDTFTASGQQRTFGGTVSNNAKPFRVVLVWTDPPGPTSGNAFINNLDLEVTVGGNTYKGNVFSGAVSVTGGAADIRDNAESVFVAPGVSGGFSVKVTATNIAGDGVPGNGQPLDQDFAIVIYNGALAPIAIGGSGSTIVSAGPNGTLDPGETVTVSLGVQNFGSGGCTTALVGTLQATGGVTLPSAPQNYGAVCSPGAPVSNNYSFTVDPLLPCGSVVTASLAVVDGATDYGVITYTFPTGNLAAAPVENFDGVAAPVLPAGWTTTFSGSGTAVVTSTQFPDTAPNDALLNEHSTVGLAELTSPIIPITGPGQQLRFRNLFNTESNFDGEVLEISINGGAFQDILAAGGTFASGGYNSTLSTGFMNPLPGRMAWTGLSGGTAAAPTYITTLVNLPPAAAGQNIQLKWRQGSDSSVVPTTNPGSRIDTITLNSLVCQSVGPVPTAAGSRKTHGAIAEGVGMDFDVALPLTGTPGIECRAGGATNDYQIVVTFANPVTVTGSPQALVTLGAGTIGSGGVANGGAVTVNGAEVTVPLTNVNNAQTINVTLRGVSAGSNNGDVVIPMSKLLGDTNANGAVNSADVTQTKARIGQVLDMTNFRSDINESGGINSTDATQVKSNIGTGLP